MIVDDDRKLVEGGEEALEISFEFAQVQSCANILIDSEGPRGQSATNRASSFRLTSRSLDSQ